MWDLPLTKNIPIASNILIRAMAFEKDKFRVSMEEDTIGAAHMKGGVDKREEEAGIDLSLYLFA